MDILAAAIHRVLFGLNYVATASIAECDYRLRVTFKRNITCDTKHRREKIEMSRWIASYISPLYDDTP